MVNGFFKHRHISLVPPPPPSATLRASTPINGHGRQVIHFSVKPLSLHHRVHMIHPEMQTRPMNALVLRGSFTMQVFHDWLAMCLPDVPPR